MVNSRIPRWLAVIASLYSLGAGIKVLWADSPSDRTARQLAPQASKGEPEKKPTSTPPTSTPPTARRFQGRSGFFERLAPRPELTIAERAVRVAELRKAYGKSPAEWPSPIIDDGVKWKELGRLPEQRRLPRGEKPDPKIALGKVLFFDPRLSRSGEMACASCHDPDLSWGDGRMTSFGLGRKPLARNAPSLLNVAHAESFFWDGRAKSLEDQARQVLLNPHEMGSSEDLIVERISQVAGYREHFKASFGDEQVSMDRVCEALATFERTLVGGRSSFDRFLSGQKVALSDEALLGLDLFRRDARCMNCHHGPLLSDGLLHDIGLSYYGRPLQDLGRYEITRKAEDVGRFRTPSLRNVSRTAPYMHNGIFPLDGVLNMYNAGMPTLTPKADQQKDPLFPRKSPHLRPLGLNRSDLSHLKAFLLALEEPRTRMRPPRLPEDEEAVSAPRPGSISSVPSKPSAQKQSRGGSMRIRSNSKQ